MKMNMLLLIILFVTACVLIAFSVYLFRRARRDTSIRFYGTKTSVRVQGLKLKDPFIYLCHCREARKKGANPYVIDSSLPVDLGAADDASLIGVPDKEADEASGILQYDQMTPEQRGVFLTWIAGDCSYQIDNRMMFLYLAGLEYRVTHEQADHLAVCNRILNLFLLISTASKTQTQKVLRLLEYVIATTSEPFPNEIRDMVMELLGPEYSKEHGDKRVIFDWEEGEQRIELGSILNRIEDRAFKTYYPKDKAFGSIINDQIRELAARTSTLMVPTAIKKEYTPLGTDPDPQTSYAYGFTLYALDEGFMREVKKIVHEEMHRWEPCWEHDPTCQEDDRWLYYPEPIDTLKHDPSAPILKVLEREGPYVFPMHELFTEQHGARFYESMETQKRFCEFLDSVSRSIEPDIRITGESYTIHQLIAVYEGQQDSPLQPRQHVSYLALRDFTRCIGYLGPRLLAQKQDIMQLYYELHDTPQRERDRLAMFLLLEKNRPHPMGTTSQSECSDIADEDKERATKILLLSYGAEGYIQREIYEDIKLMGKRIGLDDACITRFQEDYTIQVSEPSMKYITRDSRSYPIDGMMVNATIVATLLMID